MSVNPPEAEFQGTISKFIYRNKISSLLVYELHKKCKVVVLLIKPILFVCLFVFCLFVVFDVLVLRSRQLDLKVA